MHTPLPPHCCVPLVLYAILMCATGNKGWLVEQERGTDTDLAQEVVPVEGRHVALLQRQQRELECVLVSWSVYLCAGVCTCELKCVLVS